MPELDSHARSSANPTPLETQFSPWHACGPEYEKYAAGMRRCSHLKLLGVTLRLAPGQSDVEGAAQQWQEYFGIRREKGGLLFTNSRLEFVPGVEGQPEGLESITIEVKGKKRFDKMLEIVSKEGLCGDGWTNLLGVKWYFVLKEDDGDGQRKGSKL
jgi:hypothetical protein